MKSTSGNAADPNPAIRRLISAATMSLAIVFVSSLAASQAVAGAAIGADGFAMPFAGTPKYQRYAPTETVRGSQINRPLGMRSANRLARELGLNERDVFTAEQYRLFVSGKGNGGDQADARLVRASIRILTNTTGSPQFARVNGKLTPVVLGSYGLTVNRAGKLESPANNNAPTRKINKVIAPGGYFPKWCRLNGASASLRMLYRSAYTSEVIYGNKAQQQSGAAQLVPNQKRTRGSIVGMSMAPALWFVNFTLMYTGTPRWPRRCPPTGHRSPRKWRWRSQKAAPGECRSATTYRRSPANSGPGPSRPSPSASQGQCLTDDCHCQSARPGGDVRPGR